MRVIKILILVSVLLFMFILTGYPYTWYLEGSVDYYYYVQKKDYINTQNASNTQVFYKNFDDRHVVVKNSVHYGVLSSLSYPVSIDESFKTDLSPYYEDENNNRYMSELALSIVGDAITLNEAASRIAHWVRDNVRYRLGTATDPVNVIETGQAYCEGYANVATYLFRAAGIPARTISGYVPPGFGWGGNRGGYHAWLEFYYPGHGWLSIDPQSSMNFVDPFHISNYRHGAGPVKTLSVVDNSYIIDYENAPQNWETFESSGRTEVTHPVFITSLRDPDGNNVTEMADFSFVSRPDLIDDSGRSRYWYNQRGFKVTFYENLIVARTSQLPRYVTYIIDSTEDLTHAGSEMAVLSYKSYIYINRFDYKGIGKYFVEADFGDDDVKMITLYNAYDKLARNESVDVTIGSVVKTLQADTYGRIYLSGNGVSGDISVRYSAGAFTINFDEKPVVTLPPQEAGDDPVEVFIREKQIVGGRIPILLCALYDRTGRVASDAFDLVTVYSPGLPPVRLHIEAPGIVRYARFEKNRDYYLLFGSGNTFIKKKIRFTDDSIMRLDINMNDYRFQTLSIKDSMFNTGKLLFYELYDENNVLVYNTVNSRIKMSFPEGDYLFTTEKTKLNAQFISVRPGVDEYAYEPEIAVLDQFDNVKRFLGTRGYTVTGIVNHLPVRLSTFEYNDLVNNISSSARALALLEEIYQPVNNAYYQYLMDDNVAAEVRKSFFDELETLEVNPLRVHFGNVTLFDVGTGRVVNYPLEKGGFFYIHGLRPGNPYRLYYQKDDLLIVKDLVVNEPGNKHMLLENKGNRHVINAKRYQTGYYKGKEPFFWHLPFMHKNRVVSLPIPLYPHEYSGLFYVFSDLGTDYFGVDKNFGSFVRIHGMSEEAEYHLYSPLNEEDIFEEYSSLYDGFFKDKTMLLVRLFSNNSLLKNNYVYIVGYGSPFKIESNGIACITSINKTDVGLLFSSFGYHIMKSLSLTKNEVNKLDVNLDDETQITLRVSSTYGNTNRLRLNLYKDAEFKDDRLIKFSDKKIIVLDELGLCRISLPDGKYYLEVARGKYEAFESDGTKKMISVTF